MTAMPAPWKSSSGGRARRPFPFVRSVGPPRPSPLRRLQARRARDSRRERRPAHQHMKQWEYRERAREVLARETGYVLKPHGGRLRVALAFPNTYWVGMSSLGFQTVYRLFNDLDDVVCERVFLPPKQELRAQLAERHAAPDARIPDTGLGLRRLRLFGLLRMGLHQRGHDAAAGRPGAEGRARGAPAIRSS